MAYVQDISGKGRTEASEQKYSISDCGRHETGRHKVKISAICSVWGRTNRHEPTFKFYKYRPKEIVRQGKCQRIKIALWLKSGRHTSKEAEGADRSSE